MSLSNPYEVPHREQLKKELIEMLLEKQDSGNKKNQTGKRS